MMGDPMPGCEYYAGRGSYWGPWVIAAAMTLWPAMMFALTWWARRNGQVIFFFRLLITGWAIGVFGLVAFFLLRSIVSTARDQQAPYCSSYAHLWLTYSWLLLLPPLICVGGLGCLWHEVTRWVAPRGGGR
jgi:H+/Cl- antiporter ClcA